MNVLVFNSGSSSLKCAFFEKERVVWEKSIDTEKMGSIEKEIFSLCDELNRDDKIDVIGHRIVHGGEKYTYPVLITPEVIEEIRRLIPLAPLHHPRHLQEIQALFKRFPEKKQVAVFDTAFHHTLKEEIYTYPLPYEYRKLGVRRYGFHGISHQYASERATELLKRPLKVVTCHLGAGASLCAVDKGKSCDTSMGLTPLDGLMMNTRPGSVDPGILLYLLENNFKSIKELNDDLNDRSGLLGISGKTENMKEIVELLSSEPRARLAFDMYIHRLVQEIASMAASMQGIEALVFTGGIGENSSEVREASCKALSFLGIHLDLQKNREHSKEDRIISTKDSLPVLIIHTREEFQIAQECQRFKGKK